jgi:hypothetical protein
VRCPRRKKDFFIFHAHCVQGFPTTSPQLPHTVFTQQIPIATERFPPYLEGVHARSTSSGAPTFFSGPKTGVTFYSSLFRGEAFAAGWQAIWD